MALINIENDDPWLLEYEGCERLFREIMEQFTLRERESRMSQAFASLSANIRLKMTQYTQKISQLKIKVQDARRLRTITVEEAERRFRQVEQLQSKDVQLHQLYNSHTTVLVNSRADLFKTGSSAFVDAGTTSWAVDDDEPLIDIHVSATDLKQHQEKVLQEQEKGLEELCKVIARQKQIGQAISNEVEYQNEIIDDLADHMERTDESLINKTRQVQNIGKRDRTCGYWMVIIVLFVSILVVASV